MKKKKWFFGLIIITIIVAVFSSITPNQSFILKDFFSHVGENVSLKTIKESKLNTINYSLEDLKNNENATFDQSLMLINTDYKIKDDTVPDISEYKNVKMNSAIISSYKSLSSKVYEKFDNKLYVSSCFRTAEKQQELIDKLGDTATEVNASEHQMGLALDVYVSGFAGEGFIKCDEGMFINEKCWEDGFIIRYPYYGEYHTKIKYEPWHIRYVGFPHAEIIYKNTLTLETYVDGFKIDEFYKYGDYIITRQNGENFTLPSNFKNLIISPDNTGSFIITMQLA